MESTGNAEVVSWYVEELVEHGLEVATHPSVLLVVGLYEPRLFSIHGEVDYKNVFWRWVRGE